MDLLFIFSKANLVNTSVIPAVPAVPDDNAWAPVIDDTIYQDKPIISKKYPKKEVSIKFDLLLLVFLIKLVYICF